MSDQLPKQLTDLAKKPVVMLAIVVIAGVGFLMAGYDPLELFNESANAPIFPIDPSANLDNWWYVTFTDPANVTDPQSLSGSVAEALIDEIDVAQESIHIASFEFNLDPVADALIAAHERGVEVQWVTDDEHGLAADNDDGHGQFARLKQAGIMIKDDDRSALMHNKFWIFDRQIVWTGSTNITHNGIFRNNNNVLLIADLDVAEIYEREFAEMWEGKFGPRSPSTVETQQVTVAGTPIQVLFAAEDNVVDEIVSILKTAEHEVRFMAFSFTNNKIGNELLRRAVAGVDVQGVFESRASETEFSELSYLFCAGVAIRQDGNPATLHHKVIVIDGETVITGSLNFSENADRSNDENVIIISNPEIAALYLDEFDRRWVEGAEPETEEIQCR